MIIKLNYVFYFVLFFLNNLIGQELIYPVGYYKNNEKIIVYLIYQKNSASIELVSWDPVKKTLGKSVPCEFNPTNFSVIPENGGFSFIDSGIIWIKSFAKKLPRPLHFLEPLYGYEQIQWVDHASFYLSAKKNHYFSLFRCDSHGNCISLVFKDGVDFLFPSLVDDDLFFIMRDNKKNYFFAKLNSRDEHQPEIISLLRIGVRSSLFLHMVNKQAGFFLQLSKNQKLEKQYCNWDYMQVYQSNEGWHKKKLFSFAVPAGYMPRQAKKLEGQYFFQDHCSSDGPMLYESLFRCVPVYSAQQGGIFFTNFLPDDRLQLFFFDCVTKEISLISPADEKKHFFAPLIVDGILFYGGTLSAQCITQENTKLEPPYMHANMNADVFLQMPCTVLKKLT